MSDQPAILLSLFTSQKLLQLIGCLFIIEIVQGTNSVFVLEVLVHFCQVLLCGVGVGVVNQRQGNCQALCVELEVLCSWALLSFSCEEKQWDKQQQHNYLICLPTLRIQQNRALISQIFTIHIIITRIMQVICDYEFDLTKPVMLLHPHSKFWEVTLAVTNVVFRVGKVRDGVQSAEEKVEKDYPSPAAARITVIQKIKDKLTKGYVSKDAKHREPANEEQKPRKEAVVRQSDRKFKAFSGQYYERDDGKDSVKVQVNGNRIKLTRNLLGKKEDIEYRECKSNDDAILQCIEEEETIKKEGYKAMSHKFIYSFVEEENKQKSTRPKVAGDKGKNILSITDMTDDAISHRSRNNSSAKSDRSFMSDDEGEGQFKDTKSALGPPTSACIKVLLAETYDNSVDPAGWIMSEKLDGVRCFWTGTVMFSRNGNRFFPPKFFTKNWPKSQLDGQLFIGRGRFSETISAVKKNNPIDDEWKKVRYLVFDCPGLKKPFKTRIKALEKTLNEVDNPYIKCHAHRECTGFTDLFEELEKVNKIDGEGLMLRDPESQYENRRSKSLLKVKTFHDDEAVVIGYTAGTGRCTGMVGALKVRNTHGVQFEVGSGLTDDLRRKPPKIGTKITYKYQEFNKDSGKPRFPTYMRTFDYI